MKIKYVHIMTKYAYNDKVCAYNDKVCAYNIFIEHKAATAFHMIADRTHYLLM